MYTVKPLIAVPPKADSVLYIMRTLVDRFRTIVRHLRWIQRPGIMLALLLIVLAFLATAQQRIKGLTSHYHRFTMPTGSIPNAHNEVSLFRIVANENLRLATLNRVFII